MAKPAPASLAAQSPDMKAEASDSLSAQSALAALQSDVQPVGHDYVEEVTLLMLALYNAFEVPYVVRLLIEGCFHSVHCHMVKA